MTSLRARSMAAESRNIHERIDRELGDRGYKTPAERMIFQSVVNDMTASDPTFAKISVDDQFKKAFLGMAKVIDGIKGAGVTEAAEKHRQAGQNNPLGKQKTGYVAAAAVEDKPDSIGDMFAYRRQKALERKAR